MVQFSGSTILRTLPHSLQEGSLVAAVAEHLDVIVTADFGEKPLENLLLLLLAVGPEGEPRLRVALDDDHADQVDEAFVGQSLHVEVDLDGAGWKLWCSEEIGPLVADGQRL
jgi:hypothetical protein